MKEDQPSSLLRKLEMCSLLFGRGLKEMSMHS